MKTFCIKICIIIIAVFGMDYAFGFMGSYWSNHAISGMTEKNKYICDRTNEDVLILGSSRAVHHYDPTIIEDSLQMSCYNCGYDGCGSITAYGLLRMITERYSPRLIMYEVTPEFDYLKTEKDNTKYLYPLKMFYDRDGIDSIFIKVDPSEQYKIKSMMYRMNSQLIVLLSENYMKRNETIKGYLPTKRVMQYEPVNKEEGHPIAYDSLKIECLNRITDICKEKQIKLAFLISPYYQKSSSSKYSFIENLAKQKEVTLMRHDCDSSFVGKKNYFYDSVHLNSEGATAYTNKIVSELRGIVCK